MRPIGRKGDVQRFALASAASRLQLRWPPGEGRLGWSVIVDNRVFRLREQTDERWLEVVGRSLAEHFPSARTRCASGVVAARDGELTVEATLLHHDGEP